jgi:hypothetical protein
MERGTGPWKWRAVLLLIHTDTGGVLSFLQLFFLALFFNIATLILIRGLFYDWATSGNYNVLI